MSEQLLIRRGDLGDFLDGCALDPRAYRDGKIDVGDMASYLLCESATRVKDENGRERDRKMSERVFEYRYEWVDGRLENGGRDITELARPDRGGSLVEQRLNADTYASTFAIKEAYVELGMGDVMLWQSGDESFPELRVMMGIKGLREKDGVLVEGLQCFGVAGDWSEERAMEIAGEMGRVFEDGRDLRRNVVKMRVDDDRHGLEMLAERVPELREYVEWIESEERSLLEGRVFEAAERECLKAEERLKAVMNDEESLEIINGVVRGMEDYAGMQVDVSVNTGCGADPSLGMGRNDFFAGRNMIAELGGGLGMMEVKGEGLDSLSRLELNAKVMSKIKESGAISKVVENMPLWRVGKGGFLEKMIINCPKNGCHKKYASIETEECRGCRSKVPRGVWMC